MGIYEITQISELWFFQWHSNIKHHCIFIHHEIIKQILSLEKSELDSKKTWLSKIKMKVWKYNGIIMAPIKRTHSLLYHNQ